MSTKTAVRFVSFGIGVVLSWMAYEIGNGHGYLEGYDIGYRTGELNGKTEVLERRLKELKKEEG